MTAPSVSNKLRDLQSKGLIERAYSTEDTRLKQVILTEKAIYFDKQFRDEIEKFESRIQRMLSEKEKNQLMEIIKKIKDEFE